MTFPVPRKAVRRLLQAIVRLKDRADLLDQLPNGRGYKQERDRAMLHAETPRDRQRLAPAEAARGGQEDLLLQGDVLEEPRAEGGVGDLVDFSESGHGPPEQVIQAGVVGLEEV